MIYSYKPQKTCSRQIQLEIEDGIVKKVQFVGGCNGNLQGIAALVEGMPCQAVVDKLSGINCGMKGTSCPDQLTKAIKEAMEK